MEKVKILENYEARISSQRKQILELTKKASSQQMSERLNTNESSNFGDEVPEDDRLRQALKDNANLC